MQKPQVRRPVETALAAYEILLRQTAESGVGAPLPSERKLATRWGLSSAAVNRAATRLIAAGRLRREGYKLLPLSSVREGFAGARILAITHRAMRFPDLPADAAHRGLKAEEQFFVGRDTLRQHLRKAAAQRVDGLLIRLCDGGWEWDAEIAQLERLRIPCVVCDEAPAGLALAAEDWRAAGAALVGHLATKGHTEIAFIGSLRRAHRSVVVREAYVETCLRLGLTAAAAQLVELAAHTDEAVATIFARIREQWPATTAIVLYDVDSLPALLAAVHDAGLTVPDDISVVAAGDRPAARLAQPPVTCASFDSRTHSHMALDLLCRLLAHTRRSGHLPTPPRLRLEPALIERASVRNLSRPGVGATSDRTAGLLNRTAHAWSQDRETRLREVEAANTHTHRLIQDPGTVDFCPLDLRPLANRAVTRNNSWLGHLPLLHLPTGRLPIHGVPFEIIDERANQGHAALVLRSQRQLAHSAHPLPYNAVIPVGRQVRAVYFLHGCGYVGEPSPFAWYDFVLEDGRPISVPLVARGLGRPRPKGARPNIQDWWNGFPQFESEGVKSYVVTANGDPFEYERYLYTMEWENPRPQIPLREIRISTNPTQSTTLGVLAITLLPA